MKGKRRQDGFALITVLAILAIFLAVCILILTMTAQNAHNFGNAYQKQRYYDVAEAGIDRGLRDLDSGLPSPGSAGFTNGTPAPPPSPPSSNQTPLPNIPNVPYYYSYWYNASATATSTPDPLAGSYGVSSTHTVNVPANGALIWSHTATNARDVAAETVVSRFGTSDKSCAICAGQSITVSGSKNFSTPGPPSGPVCGNNPSGPYKICSDPNSSPSPWPTSVPIVTGGSYTCSGSVPPPCTLTPTAIQTNAPPGVLSGFLASQATIDQLSNAAAWQALSTTTSNVKYIDCSSGCDIAALTPVAPSSGQITFVNGNMSLSSNAALPYSGIFIVSGCLSVNGKAGMQGTSTASTMVLGTDAACGGAAANFSGSGNAPRPAWNGGTLYTVQGSVSVSGNGAVKGYNFYGAIIAANSVTVTGNGFFAWQSADAAQTFGFGPFVINSFAQY